MERVIDQHREEYMLAKQQGKTALAGIIKREIKRLERRLEIHQRNKVNEEQ